MLSCRSVPVVHSVCNMAGDGKFSSFLNICDSGPVECTKDTVETLVITPSVGNT